MGASRASKRSRRKEPAKKKSGAESCPAIGRAPLPERKPERAIRFAPEKALGAGGLCEVFAARDLLRLEHGDGAPLVAVKRLLPRYADDPAARRLLAREFFIARNITHSGVVRVFDLHEEAGALCLSMELLQGRSAYAMLERYPSGLGAAVYPLARQLLETLAALHRMGIAHGDVKPGNLMLERNSRLVLFDFNTAEAIPRPGRASSPVNQGLRSSLGLAAYSLLHASPERLEGRPPSFADDVFAACCTLYELAEGRHPFDRKSSLEAREAGMVPRPMSLRNDQRQKMLLRGLSFKAAQRPAAKELIEAFRLETAASRWFAWLHAGLYPEKEF